jgi:hypothetical protein
MLLAGELAWSQPAAAPTNAIAPTVTVAMGDVGGKFFGKAPDAAKTRRYYITAEPELWDYAPQGQDPICGKPLPPPVLANRRGGKIRYVQYTDETFSAKVFETPRLGLLGPALRGSVGEFLAITFVNRTSRPLSMHPHGARYDKDSEGSYYQPRPGLGAAVGPGAKFTYVWHLDEGSGPMPNEPSSKGWLYHSHVEGDEEADLGLVGFIIVTDPKRARADGTPNDIDREMAALFMIHDESGIGAAAKEAAEYGSAGMNMPVMTWTQVQEQTEQGARHAINGFIFGNTPGLEMNEGEKVRWYLFGLGSEQDFHTAHWHGLRVVEEGRRQTDVVELLPATMKTADMLADNPGSWLFHCHVADHMMEGMFARVIVHAKGSTGVNRAPSHAFFGLPGSQQSLQVKRAAALLDPAPANGRPFELRLEGSVSVFHAFSVFTQPVQIQLGEKSVIFKPDRRGVASGTNGSFRAKNANQYGVIYGGLMEFETTLSGEDWLKELRKLGFSASNSAPNEVAAPITMSLGNARHKGSARVTLESRR